MVLFPFSLSPIIIWSPIILYHHLVAAGGAPASVPFPTSWASLNLFCFPSSFKWFPSLLRLSFMLLSCVLPSFRSTCLVHLTFPFVSPFNFSPFILSLFILFPFVLSPLPWPCLSLVFLILCPSPCLSLVVSFHLFRLSPFISAPSILFPFILSPCFLSLFIFSLHPLKLSPIYLSRFILSPFTLSPSNLCPFMLSSSNLCPFILSPFCTPLSCLASCCTFGFGSNHPCILSPCLS